MKHTWHRNRCPKCGVTRHVPPGPRREFPKDASGKEDRSRTNSPFRYHLPDGKGDLDIRPGCAAKGASRTARRNGRARKVLAASRAGGHRLPTREVQAKLDALERVRAAHADAVALEQDGGVTALAPTESDRPSPETAEAS